MNQPCTICQRTGQHLTPDFKTGKGGHLCGQCHNLVQYMLTNGWWLSQAANYLGLGLRG